MKKRIEDLRLIENIRLNDEYFEIVLISGHPLPEILPGQFAEVRVDGSETTFLRRPFSFFDTETEKQQVRLLIQIVGEGTQRLSEIKPGTFLNLIYPLGRSFSLPEGKKFLLVAGGVGIAPMLLLGKWLRAQDRDPVFLFGFRSHRQFFELDRFEALGEVYVTTEDGSLGVKGLVTAHPLLADEGFSGIYTCGPEPMMKAVAHVAAEKNLFCEASLENTMACGFGACLTCARQTTEGVKMVCSDGPVLNTKQIIWQT
ncbi:MAG: dihydroorotate dehydrogenase electron transfer subunit [Chlorobi bacterium]|nr:dihydroorotate dehydrogenase electron transfer subunit [Chlorobiota bacterium]